MKKRLLSLMLAVLLGVGLLSVAPMSAYAAGNLADVRIIGGTITVSNGVEGCYYVSILDSDGKMIGMERVDVNADGTATKATTYTDAVSVGHSIPRKADAPAEHTHTWDTGWTYDENGHWHKCTAAGCDISVDDYATCGEPGAAYSGHVYSDASDTTCACGYVRTVTPPVTTYTITASAGTGGSISPSGSVSVSEGGNQTFTISANTYYSIADVKVDGTSVGKVSSYTFSNVIDNHTIAASFTYVGNDGGNGGGGGGVTTYSITIEDAAHGDVTSNRTSASSGTTVTLTVDPDAGYELDELTVTDRNGKEIKLTNKGDGKYTFTMPASKVTVEASFAKIQEQAPVNPFVDVAPGSYYYDAVLWAVENGITSGTSATTFSPSASCTRAQTVTFLWRAAGSPAASGTNPFTDVSPNAYYYDAVLWAVQNGITNGTSATTFSPDAVVTRGQNVTFLWRWAGSPEAGQSNPFTDVAADAYYNDAVIWAAGEGVTAGTSATTFSPDDPCLRSQIVTFLYRYIGE